MTAIKQPETDPIHGNIHLAGERVPAGRYRQVETRRIVCLEDGERLPGSLDGRVACYKAITSDFPHRASRHSVPENDADCKAEEKEKT